MHRQQVKKRSSWKMRALAAIAVAMLCSCNTNSQPSAISAGKPSQNQIEVQHEQAESSPMNNRRLGKLLQKHFPDREVEGQPGLWRIALSDEELPAESDEPVEKREQADTAPKPKPDAEKNGKPVAEQPAEENFEQEIGPGADKKLPPVLLVMTDERADRMRIMIPIRPFDPQNVEDLQLALIALHANYDRALDARYAIHESVLWSAFIHPLGSLTPDDLSNAIKQVISLRDNTGTTYSSGALLFAPQGGEEEAPEQQEPPKPGGLGDNVT